LGFGRQKFLLDIQGTIAHDSKIPPLRTVSLFRQTDVNKADIEEIKKMVNYVIYSRWR
jgi:hypothetical protein